MLSDQPIKSPLHALTPLVMGGAGFSYQLHPEPESLPVLEIISRAFALGLKAIDTSPYYEPSEQLIGAALSHAEITAKYERSDYVLMTKVGRVGENHFDYSPNAIKASVARSLQRFQTSYLDVVFCHDVEFVSVEQAVTAVGTLFEMSDSGLLTCVGISGYDIDVLVRIAQLVLERYGRPVDVVQIWAQLTLQNTRLEQRGLQAFREARVKAVCASSPLAVGLLRAGGIPAGRTGDWHPAPQGLRKAAELAAACAHQHGQPLSSLALRFAIMKAVRNSQPDFAVTTITGISTISDLEQNVGTAKQVLKVKLSTDRHNTPSSDRTLNDYDTLDNAKAADDQVLFDEIRAILGSWVDYDFSSKSK